MYDYNYIVEIDLNLSFGTLHFSIDSLLVLLSQIIANNRIPAYLLCILFVKSRGFYH